MLTAEYVLAGAQQSTNMSQMYGFPGGMGGSVGMVGGSVNGGGFIGSAAPFGSVAGGGIVGSAPPMNVGTYSPAPMMSPTIGGMSAMVSAMPVCTENLYSLPSKSVDTTLTLCFRSHLCTFICAQMWHQPVPMVQLARPVMIPAQPVMAQQKEKPQPKVLSLSS